MKKSEIKVGGYYKASVNGRVVTVRVDAVRVWGAPSVGTGTRYDVTNTVTGRTTTFRSAAKFRSAAVEPVAVAARSSVDTANASYDSDDSMTPATNDGPGGQHRTPKPSDAEEPVDLPVAPSGLAAKLAARRATVPAPAPHVIVTARAGTGKTTTLIQALRHLTDDWVCGCKGTAGRTSDGAPVCRLCEDGSGVVKRLDPSPQQRAVYDAVLSSRGVAPSAVCFVAFNRSIADELRRRVPAGVDACTNHSLGLKAVTAAFGRVTINQWRVHDVLGRLLKVDARELKQTRPGLVGAVVELVGLCKANLLDPTDENLMTLVDHFDVDLEGVSWGEVSGLVLRVIEACKDVRADNTVDYDDMIWLPVVLGLPVKRYDLLMVDESQDLNRCQQALIKMAGRRLVLCGDPRQAIYGFAGADNRSMDRMAEELAATDRGCLNLPLTVTRRCGRAIVAEANKIVPDFSAHESNPDGVVRRLTGVFADDGTRTPGKDYGPLPGDMVLCRVNAPLVSECFALIKQGKKANIQGRDVAKGLIKTVDKLKANTVADLITKLGVWLDAEQRKENAKKTPSDARLISLQDRHDCLICFTSGLGAGEPASMVVSKINAVFTDDRTVPGVLFSSCHKAKGLEAKRVFVIEPGRATIPHPMAKKGWAVEQEWNLRYVAVTRAIEELVLVS